MHLIHMRLTCISTMNKEENSLADKYQCSVCGYIYDPDVGDEPWAAPGTSFEELPADWLCPVCGADKDMFEKM